MYKLLFILFIIKLFKIIKILSLNRSANTFVLVMLIEIQEKANLFTMIFFYLFLTWNHNKLCDLNESKSHLRI